MTIDWTTWADEHPNEVEETEHNFNFRKLDEEMFEVPDARPIVVWEAWAYSRKHGLDPPSYCFAYLDSVANNVIDFSGRLDSIHHVADCFGLYNDHGGPNAWSRLENHRRRRAAVAEVLVRLNCGRDELLTDVCEEVAATYRMRYKMKMPAKDLYKRFEARFGIRPSKKIKRHESTEDYLLFNAWIVSQTSALLS